MLTSLSCVNRMLTHDTIVLTERNYPSVTMFPYCKTCSILFIYIWLVTIVGCTAETMEFESFIVKIIFYYWSSVDNILYNEFKFRIFNEKTSING